jgi:hypothetical protein
MRGTDRLQESLFTVAKLDDFGPAEHQLRPLRDQVNVVLRRLSGLVSTMYADSGRESIAPENLLLSALRSMIGSGTTRCFPRTAIA